METHANATRKGRGVTMAKSTNDSVWQLSEGRGDLHDTVHVLIASANEIYETRDVVASVTGNTDDIDHIHSSVGTLVDTLTAKLLEESQND